MGKPIKLDHDTFVFMLSKFKSMFAGVSHGHAADDVRFSDGTTFQMKLDAGELKGATGAPGKDGANGANGKDGAAGANGKDGAPGKDGVTFTPSVSSEGVISWTNNGSLQNPESVNIKGPKGETGAPGATGPQGDTGAQGATGPAGPAGPTGAQGPTGSQGPTGPAGPNIVSTSTATSGLAGLLKASGNKVVQAVAGLDYTAPITYTTTEVSTGNKWIDGKPIYRYVWKGDYTLVNPVGISIPLPSPIDTLIHFQGFVTGGTGYRILTFAHYAGEAYTITPTIDYANGLASLVVGSAAAKQYKTCTLLFIIEYTKADPSAVPALPEGPEIFDEPYPDEAIARADYIAMMAGIEIPENVKDDVQSDPNGMESPSIGGESARSAHYDTVARYYKYDCWNEAMVRTAVGRWITEDEAEEILTTQEGGGSAAD